MSVPLAACVVTLLHPGRDPGSTVPAFVDWLGTLYYLVLFVVSAPLALVHGLWALLVPRITIEPGALLVRDVPLRSPRRLRPEEIVWRRDAHFVGRYLLTRVASPRRVRISCLRRSD